MRIHSPLKEIDMISKLADLKDEHYRNTLVLTAIIELLHEKDLLTRQEIANKAAELDCLQATPHAHHPIS